MKKKSEKIKNGYRINELGVYIYGQRTVVVDGSAKILDYNKDKVVFSTNKKRVNLLICGKNLSVVIAGENVSEVSGFIQSVSFEEAGND